MKHFLPAGIGEGENHAGWAGLEIGRYFPGQAIALELHTFGAAVERDTHLTTGRARDDVVGERFTGGNGARRNRFHKQIINTGFLQDIYDRQLA